MTKEQADKAQAEELRLMQEAQAQAQAEAQAAKPR
jgi:hypothetical protein